MSVYGMKRQGSGEGQSPGLADCVNVINNPRRERSVSYHATLIYFQMAANKLTGLPG